MNKKKFHNIIIGCQMNKSDSERITSYLERHGYKYIDNQKDANLLIILSCGVRQSAEDRIYGLIPKAKKLNPNVKIILTGCLSDRDDVKKRVDSQVDLFLNIKELPKLHPLLNRLEHEDVQGDCDYLGERPKYSSNISAFVPIGNGCNNYCSYCVVPYARGREVYRKSQDIIREVKDLLKSGYKEITLIAQNVNSYHEEESSKDFADLLREVNDLEGEFWLRFATSHPKDMSDKLIKTMSECKKLCEHLHIPVQSGDDDILQAMNRKYSANEYLLLIDKIKKAIPNISFTSDIIVGFPGETEEQFKRTLEVVKKVAYDMLYIGQYSPRPGTAASKLDDNVTKEEKRDREERLMDVLRECSLDHNKQLLNQKIEVLVEGKNKKGLWHAKTRTGKSLIIDGDNINIKRGMFLKVKIKKAEAFGLKAELL